MPELNFSVTAARAVAHAAAPVVALVVEIASDAPVQSLMLQTQVRIDAPQRTYTAEEQSKLTELFGEPSRWHRSLQGLLWTQLTTVVRGFDSKTELELMLPVTFDFSVSAAKYFDAVDGDVPLGLLFSGTVFHQAGGSLQAGLVPWNKEARFRFPAALWKQTLEHHFPGRAPVSVDRDLLARLRRFQIDRGLPSVDRALEELLGGAR